MSRLHEIKKALNELSEKETKQLLFLTMHQVEAAANDPSPDEHLYHFLKEIYDQLLRQNPSLLWQPDAGTSKVHIVFGASPAGSLKMALKAMSRSDTDKVISFDLDHFAFGPLYMLHTEEGRKLREEWLRNHINFGSEGYELDNEEYHGQMVSQLTSIPPEARIVLWICKNAHEQTGLYFASYLLRNHPNPIVVIDADEACGNKYNTPDYTCKYKHTGEIPVDKMLAIYDETEKENPLPGEARRQLEEQWLELAHRPEVLRVWEDNVLKSVGEDHFDTYLLHTVEELQSRLPDYDFIKSARVIGEAIGRSDDYIGDLYFEYRLRHLVYEGKLEIKGVPRAMRYYSVRRKSIQ